MTGNPRRDRLLIIYLCFFVSVLAGLIYEILWNKYLALFIGSTGRAHVMTLAVYMGGLALGSAVFGRRDVARKCLAEMRELFPRDLRLYHLESAVARSAGEPDSSIPK